MKTINEVKSAAKILAKQSQIKIKEALEILSIEAKFKDWKSYKDSLDIEWYSKGSPFLNHWFASYLEAKKHHQEYGGYLLTFKGQFFISEKEYIRYIGLDPENEVWKRIDFDVSTSKSVNLLKKYL
ncbi:hypothetical protein MJH12_07155 [bacterium]|nr:hypothetical protein [bacterium]